MVMLDDPSQDAKYAVQWRREQRKKVALRFIRRATFTIAVCAGIVLMIIAVIRFSGATAENDTATKALKAQEQAQLEAYYGQKISSYDSGLGIVTIATASCRADLYSTNTSDGLRLTQRFNGYTTIFTRETLDAYLARCAQGLPPTQP